MCEYCQSETYEHRAGCPDASGSAPLAACGNCGSAIYEGEEYVDLPDTGMVHYDCLINLSVRDWLEEFGVSVGAAEAV